MISLEIRYIFKEAFEFLISWCFFRGESVNLITWVPDKVPFSKDDQWFEPWTILFSNTFRLREQRMSMY